jgi:branched-chain amino acid transport system permease protein
MLTLSFSMVVYSLVIDGAVFQLMGGVGWALYLLGEGSMYIPRLTILGAEIPASEFIAVFYRIIVLAFLASTLMLWRIDASPFGQALRAIRDNEMRAACIGLPVWQYRWRAFIISGAFMGLAGGLYGHWRARSRPTSALVVPAKLIRCCLGAAFRGLCGERSSSSFPMSRRPWSVGRSMVFGALLIIVVFAFPRGIAGGLVAVARAVKRQPKQRAKPSRCN